MSGSAASKKIAFLINPKSGTSNAREQAKELMQYVTDAPELELYNTQGPDDFVEIAKDLAYKNYEAIFACGGDGTLNLLSKQLIGTETAMGIIPLGSGNGFARHHGIPLKWEKAIKVIDAPKISIRDTGLINGIHFVNIAGIGYAAKISHAFKNQTSRGLSGYAKTVVKNLRRENFTIRIANETGMWEGETWMVDFCNGSQWGNNFRIAPGARDDDGSFSAVIFRKMSAAKIPSLGFRFATNSVPQSPDIFTMSGAVFKIEFDGVRPLHVDGEAIAMVKNVAEVQVLPKSLKLWTF